ncbi:uncharacterized protein LOC133802092 [Humulus lupulus]|uniref:uncharacterized protein LOC133802092 n=1 Tax=Humulus lupulus TaxID=3486 RepID=UPI002B415A17|nr:uncharacterized protein LOC133802092 [Humulus lupulus]
MGVLYLSLFRGWCFSSNSAHHHNGRIVLAWNPLSSDVDIRDCTSQYIHTIIKPKHADPFEATFIYASNDSNERSGLWNDLMVISRNQTSPWILLGDFNSVMYPEERVRAGKFTSAEVHFFPEGNFDHCPLLLAVYPSYSNGLKPFRFFDMWCSHPDFNRRFLESWKEPVIGTPMYRLCVKLKRVKAILRELNKKGFGDVEISEANSRKHLLECQLAVNKEPHNHVLIEAEIKAREDYKEASKNYTSFLQQKAKMNWLKDGDSNTKLFHSSIKKRRKCNTVYAINDCNGILMDNPENVNKAFLDFYSTLLGSKLEHRKKVFIKVVQDGPTLTDQQVQYLEQPYSLAEIKGALFSIPNEKAPGPDGFSSGFFKNTWEVTGKDFLEAILSTLNSGKLLKEVNATTLTLIPKLNCPNSVSDFRPIACCNVVYKTIMKVLCTRMRQVLPSLIADNQGGFVHGRYIAHNILICQDLV